MEDQIKAQIGELLALANEHKKALQDLNIKTQNQAYKLEELSVALRELFYYKIH